MVHAVEDRHQLWFDAHHRHLSRVWNRRQLEALNACCQVLLGHDQLADCQPSGRRLLIFDGPAEPEDRIGSNELRRAVTVAFGSNIDEPGSHLYCLGQYPAPRLWLSVLPERRDILEGPTTYERLCTRMGDQAELLAQFIKVGGFETLILVSPWQRTVLLTAYLLKGLNQLGLKISQLQLVSVPYGDMQERELGQRAFGENGLYAEQWRQACQDQQPLPEIVPYFPTELRNQLRSQS